MIFEFFTRFTDPANQQNKVVIRLLPENGAEQGQCLQLIDYDEPGGCIGSYSSDPTDMFVDVIFRNGTLTHREMLALLRAAATPQSLPAPRLLALSA